MTAKKTTRRKRLSRRTFVKIGVVTGAGLTLGISYRIIRGPDDPFRDATLAPNAYLRIGSDGSVTVVVDRALTRPFALFDRQILVDPSARRTDFACVLCRDLLQTDAALHADPCENAGEHPEQQRAEGRRAHRPNDPIRPSVNT